MDSDDWLEPELYECLLRALEEHGAEIAVCGWFREYRNLRETYLPPSGVLTQEEAVKALACYEIRRVVWDKLWNKTCFTHIRFPVGKVHEEIATTCRVFLQTDRVVCVSKALYHYRMRGGSITRDWRLQHSVEFLKDSGRNMRSLCAIPATAEMRRSGKRFPCAAAPDLRACGLCTVSVQSGREHASAQQSGKPRTLSERRSRYSGRATGPSAGERSCSSAATLPGGRSQRLARRIN